MGRRFRESLLESKSDDFKSLMNKFNDPYDTIVYIINENISNIESIELEKQIIYNIGRINHPFSHNRGLLLNKNNGGRFSFEKGEFPEEIRSKIRSSVRGRVHSDKTKLLLQEIALKRKPHSKESNWKKGSAKRQSYICESPNGEHYNISDLNKFCKDKHISYDGMLAVSRTNNNQKETSGGWKCKKIYDT